MLENKTETQYAIARGAAILSEGYHDVETAKRQLAYINETAESIGYTADAELVTVEVKTTVGKAKAYVEPPKLAPVEEIPPVEPEPAPVEEANQNTP